ncbi:hypothetical protein llap_3772 [Limosa lapponica baueri]|uniref:Uncharacterized protein n=1 Tax=Limosa lapponica baueri TaxID=1758121 RepID=A0A2I0UIP8_LIMLA|nr:hypothetical protein llap_3772 [Limosa lapponica baueri]
MESAGLRNVPSKSRFWSRTTYLEYSPENKQKEGLLLAPYFTLKFDLATDFRFVLFMQLTVTVAVVECEKERTPTPDTSLWLGGGEGLEEKGELLSTCQILPTFLQPDSPIRGEEEKITPNEQRLQSFVVIDYLVLLNSAQLRGISIPAL